MYTVQLHATSYFSPEPLPETGALANHSSDFSLVKRTASRPASQPVGHTDLFMEVAPRPKNTLKLLLYEKFS